MSLPQIRKGDTFKARGIYKSGGVPVDFATAGLTIEAFVTAQSGFKRTVAVTLGLNGTFTLRADSTDWPYGTCTIYLVYTASNSDKTSKMVSRIFVNDGNR